ncbi:hypothetical protein HBB16_14270 [Pseudonocardia sp. MCCB 268]|nr:hypothetical protein [Pseudonocardia cytotoxica]
MPSGSSRIPNDTQGSALTSSLRRLRRLAAAAVRTHRWPSSPTFRSATTGPRYAGRIVPGTPVRTPARRSGGSHRP